MENGFATDSVSSRVKGTIASVLEIDPAGIDDDSSLYSEKIGLNSLTLLHVITELEREFAFELDDEAMMTADLVSVGDLVALMRDQIAAAARDNGGAGSHDG